MFPHHIAFIGFMKELVRAKTYLEIGVQAGTSFFAHPLAELSIGVDPAFSITTATPIGSTCRCALVRETSDHFFEAGLYAKLTPSPLDLAFVDGLHLCEFALRDFYNCERLTRPGSVILMHDIFPVDAKSAGRDDYPGPWMGDVFKVIPALRKFRPDLKIAAISDVPFAGMAAIWNLNPADQTLVSNYPEVIAYMDGLTYERDFAPLVASSSIKVGSGAFDAMVEEIRERNAPPPAPPPAKRGFAGFRRLIGAKVPL